MIAFESILVLLLAAVLLAAAARRTGAPYPAFLALGGVVLAFVPGAPAFVLQPELALALFVAPVLLDTAYDASPRDLRHNWVAVASLAVGVVLLTTGAVAIVTHALVPGLPWAAAIVLGAIVAPPDAAAATAVLRQVRPPHRIVTILEGESLLNDATALLIYRVAVGAALAGSFSIGGVAPTFLLVVAGSIVAGPVLGWIVIRVMKHVEDVPSAIILQFITTFGVWMLAERVGLSGVLTMVCFAVSVARTAPDLTPARLRLPAYAVWETVVFVMNVLAFVLIGLQVRPILKSLDHPGRSSYLYAAGATLVTVIVVRLAWVMAHSAIVRWRKARSGVDPHATSPPTFRGGLVIAWCGMRGIVTVAAALALPSGASGQAFPYREFIVLTAFGVVLGTLVVQGLSLRPLLQAVALPDDDPVGDEVRRARERALRTALDSLAGDASAEAEAVRREYASLLANAAGLLGRGEPGTAPEDELRRRAVAAARRALSQMRANDEIGDTAFHRLEEELDWVEISSTPR
jgi:CPA1 family monovalent cation:H+ antiporter